MKKLAILAVLPLACIAGAQGKPATPKTIACAVMTDNKVNIADATKKKMFADYKGNRYYFCCEGCPQSFAKDPAKYAKAPHTPTPKTK